MGQGGRVRSRPFEPSCRIDNLGDSIVAGLTPAHVQYSSTAQDILETRAKKQEKTTGSMIQMVTWETSQASRVQVKKKKVQLDSWAEFRMDQTSKVPGVQYSTIRLKLLQRNHAEVGPVSERCQCGGVVTVVRWLRGRVRVTIWGSSRAIDIEPVYPLPQRPKVLNSMPTLIHSYFPIKRTDIWANSEEKEFSEGNDLFEMGILYLLLLWPEVGRRKSPRHVGGG
ncbi:hypothetical protein F5888DRAFT_1636815 [Russula emetica]|nr:hypothetical protein F5888DRAFT_1636815 [Russula emetica]